MLSPISSCYHGALKLSYLWSEAVMRETAQSAIMILT